MKEKLFLALFISGLIGFVTFSAHKAYTFPGGMVGHSGKSGNNCNTCHSGGLSPDVSIEGPTTLFPNQAGTYTLTIRGGQAKTLPESAAGGFNVAVSTGVLSILADATDVHVLSGEVTHTTPKPIDDQGVVQFRFQYTAPMTPTTTVEMFGAGNSVNGMGNSSGDAASLDKLTITVQEPAAVIYLPFVTSAQ